MRRPPRIRLRALRLERSLRARVRTLWPAYGAEEIAFILGLPVSVVLAEIFAPAEDEAA